MEDLEEACTLGLLRVTNYESADKLVINSIYGIESIATHMQVFKQQGMFGLQFTGDEAEQITFLSHIMINMKRLLYDLTDVEVERAKNCQSMLVTSNLMRQAERIDEIARNIYVTAK